MHSFQMRMTTRILSLFFAYIDWSEKKTEASGVMEDTDKDNGVVYVVVIMAIAIAVVITFWLLWYIGRKKKR